MPNKKSAERRMRSSARRQEVNQSVKSRLKTLHKKVVVSLEEKNEENAKSALRSATSALDKAVKRGVIHPNTAARKKSRLATKVNALA